ncbi:MAG: response regulator [Pleurocapsa sp. MO_192.B19]|nr:response regulator [Pleurocapsa sp. MO_192.B19]
MIRVLIVDDLKLICQGIKAMFASVTDISLVGFAHNGKEAIKQTLKEKPDIVLIDVLMPVMGGIEATKEITKQFPEVKVIVLSTFEDDPIICEAIAAGAKGYLLKSMNIEELASAIRTVNSGFAQLAPGVIDSLAKTALNNSNFHQLESSAHAAFTLDYSKTEVQPELSKVQSKTKKKAKKVKKKPEKPLFRYGDWITLVIGIFLLSHTDGMGHHLGHAGLFCLMLALIARPIRFLWDAPLKYRRTIGIFAFAATVAHAIYATDHVLNSNLATILSLSLKHQWAMWAGILSLAMMAPAAITSFQSLQKKLGKNWRKIHLLTVPSLALAILHTTLIGPHYMGELEMEIIHHLRTYSIGAVALLVFLMRQRIFWSVLGLSGMGKYSKKSQVKK